MPTWKWFLVLLVLAIFWVAEPSLFPVFLVVSAVFVIVEHIRRRRHREPTRPVAVEAARLLKGTRRDRQGAWVVPMAGGHVHVGQGGLLGQVAGEEIFLTLSAPVGRRVPFCFAIRPTKPPVRWVHLVENTPIPGVRFEFQLRSIPVGSDLEAASNHPALLGDWLQGDTLRTLRVLGEAGTPALQGLHFDGRRLVSLWVWRDPPPEAILRLAAMRTLLLAGELDTLLDDVQFSQPI
ncbi:MAG: hypothetical protein ABIK09_06715 [Pseudomonadota bacterium]